MQETLKRNQSVGTKDGHHEFGFGTRVPTADGRILPKGTAINRLRMTGPENRFGQDIEACVGRFWMAYLEMPVAEKDAGLQGCVLSE